jgi:hypothetical protein
MRVQGRPSTKKGWMPGRWVCPCSNVLEPAALIAAATLSAFTSPMV